MAEYEALTATGMWRLVICSAFWPSQYLVSSLVYWRPAEVAEATK